MKGILGRKVGMTQVFTTDGELVPVTVIACQGNVVLQKRTVEVDGYTAVQIGFEDKKEKHSSKAEVGHAKKADTAPKRFVKEIRGVDINNYELGQVISTDLFEVGEYVDVTGISKGKGFQGAIKRHNQSIGPMAHGSRYHRRPGSMGAVAPNRVFKGKKLAGHMGAQRKTIQNLVVVAVDVENNYLLIKGNVPGSKKAMIMVRSAVKKTAAPVAIPKELISYE